MNVGKLHLTRNSSKVRVTTPKKLEKMKPLGGECETEYCGTGASELSSDLDTLETHLQCSPFP